MIADCELRLGSEFTLRKPTDQGPHGRYGFVHHLLLDITPGQGVLSRAAVLTFGVFRLESLIALGSLYEIPLVVVVLPDQVQRLFLVLGVGVAPGKLLEGGGGLRELRQGLVAVGQVVLTVYAAEVFREIFHVRPERTRRGLVVAGADVGEAQGEGQVATLS